MRRRLAVLGLLAVLASPLTSFTPAFAGTTAGNGARCTIVGTKGNDVLVGTARRDVICGLGGKDTIKGGGGDDVLDGGRGTDQLIGGGGNDTLLGQAGVDTLQGGPGADRLSGGAGGDRLSGQTGNDNLTGDDGNDLVDGDDGRDLVSGGTGADVVVGGGGDDALLGGSGADDLLGEAGNDELDGGADRDDLDGGDGTNWCILGAGDTQKACKYDRTPAQAIEVEVVSGSADVTDTEATMVLRARVVDDTGVDNVVIEQIDGAAQVYRAHLVSGNVRDGWWEMTSVVPRFAKPGTFDVRVQMYDRVGRSSSNVFADRITLVNRDPDLAGPVASELQVSPGLVDVRAADAAVRLDVRITDNKSGLKFADVIFHWRDENDYYGLPLLWSDPLTRVSGTERDGRYTGTVMVPKGTLGGTWSAEVRTWDSVGNQHTWSGELLYASHARHWSGGWVPPGESRIAGGTLEVTGASADPIAPVIDAVKVSQTEVDTLATGATVNLDIHATDVGKGVTGVQVDFAGEGLYLPVSGYLVEGSPADGWWRVQLNLPQGTPPGTYVAKYLFVSDARNSTAYSSPAAGDASGFPVLAPDVLTTTAGAAWDGTITVLDNPAAAG